MAIRKESGEGGGEGGGAEEAVGFLSLCKTQERDRSISNQTLELLCMQRWGKCLKDVEDRTVMRFNES